MEPLLSDGKAKVPYFCGGIAEKDVGRFKIAVDYSQRVEALVSFYDLMEDVEGLGFC